MAYILSQQHASVLSGRHTRRANTPCALVARTPCLALDRTTGWHSSQRVVVTGAKGGVIDAPTTALPGIELGTSSTTTKPPTYKVMLHNDNYNRREYVVKVLLKVINHLGVDDAVVAMQEAHDTGVALVIACPQEDAEQYCEGLRLNGLTSTIEPGR